MTERSTMIDLEIPWPKLGEAMLEFHDDGMMRLLSRDISTRASLIADAYKLVADQAIDNFVDAGAKDMFVMFPAVYCYRHYVELQLKCIIFDGCRLRGEQTDMQFGHDLSQLWRLASAELKEAWPDGTPETLEAAGAWIAELHKIDPISTAFRYASVKGGTPTLDNVDAINLKHLKYIMAKLSTFLNSSLTGMAAMWDSQNDYS